MIGFYNYTVIATYLGLFAAVFGIANVIKGELFLGVVCVIFAGLFDMFDGKIARTNTRARYQDLDASRVQRQVAAKYLRAWMRSITADSFG